MQKQHMQWLTSSEGVMQFLMQQNIPPDSRIALRNLSPESTIAWIWGIARHRSTAVLISDRDPDSVVEERCTQVAAQYLFSHTPPPKVPSLRNPVDLDRIAVILFTSGSTHRPKAVAHSLRTLIASAHASNQNIPLSSSDSWLLSLSLWHVGGLAIMFRALYSGASITLPAPSKTLGTQIEEDAVTHISVVATQLYRLLQEKKNLSSLRCILVGGGPIPSSLIAQTTHLPIHTTYGMTELGSQLCTTPVDSTQEERNTAGRPLHGWEVHIDEQNEICAKGPALFLGYLEGETLRKPFDRNGFFHTGDRGYIDAQGNLVVVGRLDQMFISGGENIHPEEIESTLCNIAGVEAALVIPIPHEEYGMRPIAFVKGCVDEAQIQKYLHHQLPRFKHPDQILPWPDSFPTQKPSRKNAQEYYFRNISS